MCHVEGTYSRHAKKLLFSCEESIPRTNASYNEHVKIAERTLHPAFGVKGKTKLAKILSIPEGLTFDPMHLLYLGVNKSLLSVIMKRKLVDVSTLSDMIEGIRVPHYFRRKPRTILSEFHLWKAQEHRVFLLYYAPFLFLRFLGQSRDS